MSSQSASQRTAAQGTVNAYADAHANRAQSAKPEGIGQSGKPSKLAQGAAWLTVAYVVLHAGPVVVCRVLLWVHGI